MAAATAGEAAAGALAGDRPEPGRRRARGRSEQRGERQSIFARAVAFLRASWAELQRMQWPDRRQTTQATAVVLGFVIVAGIYLGVADWIAQKIVNFDPLRRAREVDSDATRLCCPLAAILPA